MTNIIRTKTQGAFEVKSNNIWGGYLKRVEDPEGLPDSVINEFKLIDNFPRIPNTLWSRIIHLYFHFFNLSISQEVSVIFLRHEDFPDLWRVLVPQQVVSIASVKPTQFNFKENGLDLGATVKCIDIESGEELLYPHDLNDWWVVGSSHLHPFPMPEFSVIDDASELGFPGCHILVHSPTTTPQTYGITACIVQDKRRYYLKHDQLIDITPSTATFHPKVLDYVTVQSYTPLRRNKYTDWWADKGILSNNFSTTKTKQDLVNLDDLEVLAKGRNSIYDVLTKQQLHTLDKIITAAAEGGVTIEELFDYLEEQYLLSDQNNLYYY